MPFLLQILFPKSRVARLASVRASLAWAGGMIVAYHILIDLFTRNRKKMQPLEIVGISAGDLLSQVTKS